MRHLFSDDFIAALSDRQPTARKSCIRYSASLEIFSIVMSQKITTGLLPGVDCSMSDRARDYAIDWISVRFHARNVVEC